MRSCGSVCSAIKVTLLLRIASVISLVFTAGHRAIVAIFYPPHLVVHNIHS